MWLLLSPLVLVAQLGLAALAAVSPRPLAGLLLVVVLGLPWLISPDALLFRGVSGLLGVAMLVRGLDVWIAVPGAPMHRVAHALSIVDLRRVRSVAPRVDSALFLVGIACAVGALMLLGAAWAWVPALWTPGALFWRWTFGILSFYVGFEGADRIGRGLYLLGGVQVEPVQRTPIASRTVGEFWGKRWNAVVRQWLAEMAFYPLAKRGKAWLGSVAAFGLSAAIHAYIVLPALGVSAALRMGGFFLLHGAIVALERAIGVARAPVWVGRVWTLTWLIGTAPLFIEPLLVVAGLQPLTPGT